MKTLSAILFFCAFAFAQGRPACPNPFIGKGTGKDEKEARAQANESIAMQVRSSVRVESNIARFQKEIDGIPTDDSQLFETVSIESSLENAGAIRDAAPPKQRSDGLYEAERYLCRSDAARPFLASLERWASHLKSPRWQADKKSCESVNEIYHGKIKSLEGTLKDLGQMRGKALSLQKEYEEFYAKIMRNCSQIGRGVFLCPDHEAAGLSKEFEKTFASKISLKQGECLTGIEVQISAKERNCSKNSFSGLITCSIDVSLEGTDCGNGKGLALRGIISGTDSRSEENARRQMLKRLSDGSSSFFKEWTEKLQPWM
jgi:hypothetical protein